MLIGQVVDFSVNEVFCEVSVFGEKTGGVGRGKDMSRQKVLGSSDSLDSGLNRVNLLETRQEKKYRYVV